MRGTIVPNSNFPSSYLLAYLLTSSFQHRMKAAASEEDFSEAARLKKQRESTKVAMMEALEDAENSVRTEIDAQGGSGSKGSRLALAEEKAGASSYEGGVGHPDYYDQQQHKGVSDPYSSPVKTNMTVASPKASVHRTPSGALTRDVFRDHGRGGRGAEGEGGFGGADADEATPPPYASPPSKFPGEGGGYSLADDPGDGGVEALEKEVFPEGEHPLENVPLLNENGSVHDLPA